MPSLATAHAPPAPSCRYSAARRARPVRSSRQAAAAPRRCAALPSEVDFFESDNPQNVPPPLRGPAPQLTPEEAVRIQLEAARANDTPRTDHGVHTLYEFAADAGDMERSAYFGFSKDLYHLDHFLSIKSTYAELFRSDAITVEPATPGPSPERADVRARLQSGGAESVFVFRMLRRDVGSKAGCWLTKQLLPEGSKYLQ